MLYLCPSLLWFLLLLLGADPEHEPGDPGSETEIGPVIIHGG